MTDRRLVLPLLGTGSKKGFRETDNNTKGGGIEEEEKQSLKVKKNQISKAGTDPIIPKGGKMEPGIISRRGRTVHFLGEELGKGGE